MPEVKSPAMVALVKVELLYLHVEAKIFSVYLKCVKFQHAMLAVFHLQIV